MSYSIRDYRPSDAALMPLIFQAAVSITARYHYSDRQVAAWLARAPGSDTFARCYTDGRLAMVISDQADLAVGFADVERDGHIQYFYCHPDLSGTGVAGDLLNALEMAARRLKIARLYVEASETALGFFKRNGFKVEKRRDFEVSGVPIHNYAMDKRLG